MLDDRVWQEATPIADFVQAEPAEGLAATERTEVRLVYDDKMLYIGVMCFDSDPSQIVTTDSRRDSSLSGQDSFQMIFDTYHDRQNGFIFGTNTVGSQYRRAGAERRRDAAGRPARRSRRRGRRRRRIRRRRQRELGRLVGGRRRA